MKTKIIIISGRKQAGKSSARAFITSELSKGYADAEKNWYVPIIKNYSFADELKRICVNVFGLKEESVNGTNDQKDTTTHLKWENLPLPKKEIHELKKELHHKDDIFITGREFLKILGTYIFRHIYYDCWVLSAFNQIKLDQPDYAIMDDARFPNELEFFKNHHPYIIRLMRNPFNDPDKTESSLDNYDFNQFSRLLLLDNSKMSIEEKNEKIQNFIRKMR